MGNRSGHKKILYFKKRKYKTSSVGFKKNPLILDVWIYVIILYCIIESWISPLYVWAKFGMDVYAKWQLFDYLFFDLQYSWQR